MPLPWTRTLELQQPPMNGSDVTIMLGLVARTGIFRKKFGLASSEVFDAQAASMLLAVASDDGYVDDGKTAAARGKLYKIYVPVHRNRSIETWATLSNASGAVLLTFKVHAHGHNSDNNSPDGTALNLFTTNGNTPTGLMSLDFNSPEPDPVSYGPYPINRAVAGIPTAGANQSNAALLVPHIRSGILVHTGEWSGWAPPMEMPNSAGCLHSWPQFIHQIAELLPTLGVKMRNNTGGAMPYPYETQGLLSVELVG
eukprot:gene14185-16945_t